MQKPLVLVLAAQLLVLVGAVTFMATRGSPPAPAKHVKERPEPEPEEVLHAPLTKLVEKAEPPDGGDEWAEFPTEKTAKATKAVEPANREVEPPAAFEAVIAQLQEGNVRFVEGATRQRDAVARRESLGDEERASAVVVTCTDSRVVPELLFDQPLGTFSVVRLPGAQLDEVAVRAVEESVSRLHSSAVILLGHFGCHHVQHALTEKGSKRGFLGRLDKTLEGEALDEASTIASVNYAARELRKHSKVTLLRVVYAPKTGKLRWLDAEPDPEPAPAPRSGRR